MAFFEEAIGIDRWSAAVLVRERRKRNRALVTRAAPLRAVRHDGEDPRLQGAASLEAVEPLEHADPRLLCDLLGGGGGADIQARDPHHGRMVQIDEPREGRLFAAAQRGEEAFVIALAATASRAAGG